MSWLTAFVLVTYLLLCIHGLDTAPKICSKNAQCLPHGMCCETGGPLPIGKRSLYEAKCVPFKEEGEGCIRDNTEAEPTEIELLCPCADGLECVPNMEIPPIYGNCYPIK
ncbi:uncharacterized protein LOC106174360 [Lingula anatina]|uniref:Uncharacterized protein LOC106174360 n=1 Tax=Lingula anatina TaxID=7574 RepID=A0A1S3JMJ7_LINAN|nr:uncharacterized protein LOC106174360 [Lingula anatina]|eukprot:XP_013411356.1 uncharacterized protein LOC106174360 [Lingula anatina]